LNLAGINMDPRDVNEALASLMAVAERLRAEGDPRAIFPDIYTVITANVAREIAHETGFFHEPAFISRLASRFAKRYLETLNWSLEGQTQDCSAWALAYSYAHVDGTFPIQHAALAISAHINFDLALGIHHTIRELGGAADPERLARYKHDHDAVNALLAASLEEALQRLLGRYDCRVTEHLTGRLRPWACRRMLATLASWRAVVWEDVLDMLAAEGGAVRELVLQRMERRSRHIGYQLSRMNALGLVVRILHPLEPLLGHPHPRDAAGGVAHEPNSAAWTN
jgi:hypothetical protein